MSPAKSIPIILDNLINAVEDHCSFSYYYLDRETGEILFQSERHHTNDANDAPDLENPYPDVSASGRFIPVEPMESWRGHELMNTFIAGLNDGGIRSRLMAAVSRRNFYRSFKDVLYDYPDIWKKWHDRYSEEIKKIIEEWLQYNHILYEFVSLKNQAHN
jgi:hypothetical protein